MPRNQSCRRRGGPGRPMKPRIIMNMMDFDSFYPLNGEDRESIVIGYDEMEALRLVDYQGMNQEEAASSMGVSRGTVWRCVDSGRRKLVAMVIEGRPMHVGDVPEDVFDPVD